MRKLIALALVASACLIFVITGRTSDSPLIISEFRLRGPSGAFDEFVEIYNNTDTDHIVATTDGSAGYALVASDGIARFVIPNGTIIPARGHFLGVNSVGYSLSGYPAGNGATATGDATYTTNIPDNVGLALFKTARPSNFIDVNRLDAVGPTSEPNALYREGPGLPPIFPSNIDYTFWRLIPSQGADTGVVRDFNDNAIDFAFLDTNGTNLGASPRLGAPGPENLSSPRIFGNTIDDSPLDPHQSETDAPNVVRDFTSDPANNSTFGTLSVRRTFTNNTGANIERLRFRVVGLTTFPTTPLVSDLRPRTSGTIFVTLTEGGATVVGTTLEEPPSQVNGGGLNSTLSVDSVSPASPLPNGASINVQFLMGLQETGCYHFAVIAESWPNGGSDVFALAGDTEGPDGLCGSPTPTPSTSPTPEPTPIPSPVPSPTQTPTPPPDGVFLVSSIALDSLSPVNSDLVNVGLSASATAPAAFHVQVFGDEDDETATSPGVVHSPDAKNIGIGTLRLRAERVETDDGRVYLVIVRAFNLVSGITSRACHTVVVPKKKKGDVDAQAAAAKAFCEATSGAPPPGYFLIGDGPITGPKQ
ncbi:MAG TPA: lamin tail domain-containing protein [Pyrinomonadaceae bacterium]|nr:lamin tail domain-containing protein [Pyrinomonadaceae bacterium]